MSTKKKNISQLTKCFWELSRKRQESFLKELFQLSKQNQSLFQIRLGKDEALVMKTLTEELEKQTVRRIGRFKKLRLSKINETLRNANKYALNIHQQIQLKRVATFGMIDFVLAQKYVAERHRVSCARHLDEYLRMVKEHILEKAEIEDVFAREKEVLMNIINRGYFLPEIEDVYLKYFFPR